MPKKTCELHCDMWPEVKFYCVRGKTPTKMFQKNEICLQQRLSQSNTGVPIAQGIFGRERNSSAAQLPRYWTTTNAIY